jgi:hypothetical protein
VQTTSAFTSRPSGGAVSGPNRDGRGWWTSKQGLRKIDFLLTLCLLGAIVLPWLLGSQHSSAPLDVSVDSLSFSTVEVGAETSPQEVTLNSKGREAVKLGEITVDGSDRRDFLAEHECSGEILRMNRECTVSVTFSPHGDGSRSARLTIRSVAGDTEIVSLSGTGAGGTARASLSPPVMSVSAAEGETTTRRFTLENTGSASLKIYGVALNDQYGFFSSTNDACSNTSLESGASCSIEVNFTPTSDNNTEGELVIKHDAPGSPSRARLEGATTLPTTGKTTPSPSNTASPSSSSTASPYSSSTASPVP